MNSRVAQIQAQRQEKANYLQPDEPTKLETRFNQIERLIRRSPVKAAVGGLAPGAGFALGSTLLLHNSDRVVSKLWAGASVRKYYTVGTGVELPNMTSLGVSVALDASHSDAPQLDYYGSGPNSSKNNRTDYRREDTLFELRTRLRAHHHVTPECGIGELLLNVGPGTSDSIPSTESVFGPAQAPGVNMQSNYLLAGCWAQLDLRDLPGDPHGGTFAAVGYRRYFAQDFDPFSFNRFVATAEQYIPFFNEKRVIALRGLTELNFHGKDEVVPFYMQARLGSDSTLRGFHRNRFYDDNSILFNAEYRWEICTGFDLALFGDAGKVFNRPGEISLKHLQTDAGFGFRFKNRSSVVARIDTGFSREGVQVWLKFGKLFPWSR